VADTVEVEERAGAAVFRIRAKAGGRRNAVAGVHDGALRVEVTAAPEKGRANRAILDVLAAALGVAKRDLEIRSGESSPLKTIGVRGRTAREIRKTLSTRLEERS
jgi:hypothetical protein